MPDVGLGQPYTATFEIKDTNGTHVTGGVTGSMSLYGPASATAIGGPTALTHFGEGNWGVTWAGSLLASPGDYTYAVPTLAFAATTLTNQRGDFNVGLIGPGQQTARDLLVALCLPLNDGFLGTTTADGTLGAGVGTLLDARLASGGGVADDWVGSEVLPFQASAPTSLRTLPYRVTLFDPSVGKLTVAPAPGALVASGTDYLLCNVNGAAPGLGVQRRLAALAAALRLGGATRRASAQAAITVADGTDEYAIPAQLVSVTGAWVQASGAQADRWTPLGPALLRGLIRADRRLVTLRGWPSGTLVRLDGWARPRMPYFLDQYVDGPVDWYVTRAAADLLKASPLAAHQRLAGPLYQEAVATRPRRTPDANEIVLG